jgi:hypothetical protein
MEEIGSVKVLEYRDFSPGFYTKHLGSRRVCAGRISSGRHCTSSITTSARSGERAVIGSALTMVCMATMKS